MIEDLQDRNREKRSLRIDLMRQRIEAQKNHTVPVFFPRLAAPEIFWCLFGFSDGLIHDELTQEERKRLTSHARNPVVQDNRRSEDPYLNKGEAGFVNLIDLLAGPMANRLCDRLLRETQRTVLLTPVFPKPIYALQGGIDSFFQNFGEVKYYYTYNEYNWHIGDMCKKYGQPKGINIPSTSREEECLNQRLIMILRAINMWYDFGSAREWHVPEDWGYGRRK